MNKFRILIIDDHLLVGHAWKTILEADNRMEVVDVVSGADASFEIIEKRPVDVVLLDINMKPVTGFEMAELILKRKPNIKILAVSMHDEPAIVRKMIKSGASGYVSKNARKDEMIQAIIAVMNNKRFISADIQQQLADELISDNHGSGKKVNFSKLTEKELDILKMVKRGLTSKEIAAQLHISYKTVQVHRHNILKKLHQKNTASLLNLLNDTKFML
ncbi:MAG: response regulator transcription factor [Bacteroidetes bacterium]|nr:response regulator transcription factor [Bacteroidota bacterium]